MYLKTLNLGDIHPYERNPRINDKAVEPVMKSIEKDGYRARIIVDKDGVIIAGHTRYEAMKRLGWTEAEVWIADDMTPEQIADYRIRDNLTADFAEWDFSELEAEIAEMDLDFDMSEFEGFDDIQGGVSDTPTAEEDDFDPDEPVEPKAKLGDIYQLGRHRLMCGDSTDVNAVDALLNGENADTYIVDPPYEQENLYEVIPQNDGGRLFVFSDHKHWQKAVCHATHAGWPARFEFVWDCVQSWYTPNRPLARHKTCYVFGNEQGWLFDSAIIRDGKQRQEKDVYNTRGADHYVPLNGAVHMRTVEAFPNTAQNDENGYGKPVKWLSAMLNGYGGNDVLDLFGGSGAVMIACEQTGRNCFTMELDPHYVDVIIARWEKLTGDKAVLLNA